MTEVKYKVGDKTFLEYPAAKEYSLQTHNEIKTEYIEHWNYNYKEYNEDMIHTASKN